MIQEISEKYSNPFVVCEPEPGDYVLRYEGRGCLARVITHTVPETDAPTDESREHFETACDTFDLPRLADYPETPEQVSYLFSVGERRFFLARDEELELPQGFEFKQLNWLRYAEPADLLFAAVTGAQLDRWYKANRYCGRCGHAMEHSPVSRELVCPECAAVVYPRINPGVIVAIVDCSGAPEDDRIVLTRYNGRTTALWALVAGFTEIGEPLEDTVRREVMEEVGLNVKNLRFYKSQPWSFTDTLLVGFWCEVDGDLAITVDHGELKEARWFTRAEMPLERTDDRVSLTGEMIERFRTRGRAALREA